ncbi:MAG TPA: transglutaminase N-terminal domain-containing protein, partial [Candidatus Acidoferrales bacterium]|nr:transglutaminase N-terminal domain-containing protein [Candidatus Acidoferrales bacterium]
MKYRITHSTRYGYDEAIPLSHNVVRMRPREHETQTCLQYQMLVMPQPTVKSEGLDYFGNHVTWFSLQEPHTVLRIAAQSEVEVLPSGPHDLNHGPTWEQALQILKLAPDRDILAAREFVFESVHVPWSAE